jgi:hypothetical protein
MHPPGSGAINMAGAGVPAIPRWFREWGRVPLGIVFLVLSAMIADVGHTDGKAAGRSLFLLLLTACAIAWFLDYRRRLAKAQPLSGEGCWRGHAWRPSTP